MPTVANILPHLSYFFKKFPRILDKHYYSGLYYCIMIEAGAIEALHRAQAKKDPEAIAMAEAFLLTLRAMKQAGFEDVPLPRMEDVGEPRSFSDEARELLTREGYRIYKLTGQSIRNFREAHLKFWSNWHHDSPDFEALTSMHSEVAINPDVLFIPRSNNKTLDEQLKLIAKSSNELAKKIEGIEAIMGEAPDYIDLVFKHLEVTGDRLFGEKYGYNYARTQTPTALSSVALVGSFYDNRGLDVSGWGRDARRNSVYACPLVVPKT